MDVRYNNLLIDRFDESDGIMHVTAFARVPGVLTYRRSDGSTRNELVAPEFLKAFDSQGRPLAAKLAGIPVVNEHPAEGLIRHNEDAIARLRVGDTSNKVKVWTDGKIEVSFDVFDSQTQQDIRTGRKTGVSLGYRVNAIPQQGVWQDSEAQIRYDAVQSEPFEADHLAVCANPRAANARITRFDSAIADGWAYQIDSSTTHEDAPMARQIVVGDEVFSVGDEALAGRLLALIQENRSLQQQNSSLADYIEAMEEEEDESEEYGEEEEQAGAIGYWDTAEEETTDSEESEMVTTRIDKGPGCPGPGDCSKSGGKAKYKNTKAGSAKAKSEAAALGGLGKAKAAKAGSRLEELRGKYGKNAAEQAETVLAKRRSQLGTDNGRIVSPAGRTAVNTAKSALSRSTAENSLEQARNRVEMAAKAQSKASQPKGGTQNPTRRKMAKNTGSIKALYGLDKKSSSVFDSTDFRELLDSLKETYDMKTKKKPPMPPEDEMDMEDEETMDSTDDRAFDADDDTDDLAADILELAEVQQDHIDALEARIDELQAENTIATRILESRRTDEGDEGDDDYTDSDDRIDSIVQERVAEIMATYQDAAPYLDSDFKFDGVASKYDVMRAAIARIDSEFPGESDIDLEEATDSQIETMYRAAKRYVPRHRVDGVGMLSRAIDRVTKTPPNMDAIEIRQQRMDEDFARGRRPLNSSRK